MSGPATAPARSRSGHWLALAFALALGVFTLFTVRDAGQTMRPTAGGTFTGRDVDGRLVQVNLFELRGGWQGWLYREGHGRAEWFVTERRAHPWTRTFPGRKRSDGEVPPDSTVTSSEELRRLNVTLTRRNLWGNDTANLTREFEHVSFRRRAGLRLGRVGGTQEYRAQFPALPETNTFLVAVNRAIRSHCETGAADFGKDAFGFWRRLVQERELPGFNQHEFTANWQLRLLTTNLASFSVANYDDSGGNGNHSHWRGANFVAAGADLRPLELKELFRDRSGWELELRTRCVPKLKECAAPRPEAVFDKFVDLDVFTLSPTGLQLYFNPYAIASGADGEFVVHFDYAELKDLLRSDGPAALLPRAP